MKIFSPIFLLIIIVALISSCQKEYSAESNNSHGSLHTDSTGNCMPVLIKGIFKKDTSLKLSNAVDITLNITETGSYFVTTDTVNGYSFSGAGVVSVTGLNIIRLIGSGKPAATGANVFKVKYDNTVCEFSITVSVGTGTSSGTAVYTLGGAPGTCTGAVLSGTFVQSLATGVSNTATANVNVTQSGTYSLSTGVAINGVSFSGTGSFTATGPNSIILTASGTPVDTGSFVYPISSGTSDCNFTVIYTPAPPSSTYTLNCTGATFTGIYQHGTPITSLNTVTLSVTSAGAGAYNITTPIKNGVIFSGSGIFSGAGTQPVTLTASGLPLGAGTFTYTATAATGGSTCTFPLTFAGGMFTDSITAFIGGVYKTFKIRDSAQYDFNLVPGYNFLVIKGYSNNSQDETITLSIGSVGPIVPGSTYTLSQAPGALLIVDYVTPSENYHISSANSQNAAFSITTNNSSNGIRVSGTFIGRVYNNGGAGPGFIDFGNGIFSVTIYF